MTTAILARQQLSRDIGDFFASTATSTAGGSTTLVDTALQDFDDDDILNPFSNVTFMPTDGSQANEERAFASKSGATATMKRVFTGAIQSGVAYEMHRLFTAAEKNDAITQALDLVFPMVWAPKTAEITIVDDQFDYDISASNFLFDSPHQVRLVSNDDTELTRPTYDWDVIFNTSGNPRLHLETRFNAGDTLRLIGIAAPLIADVTGRDIPILSAQAALYLFETNIANVFRDDTRRMEKGAAAAEKLLAVRVRRHMRIVPFGRHVRTTAFNKSQSDINFRVP